MGAAWLIRGRDVPWELNQHGKMQWYLHPLIEDACLKTLIFYRQEIPMREGSLDAPVRHPIAWEDPDFYNETKLDEEAKPNGYYGYHVYVRQPFAVAALDYDGEQSRWSQIEIQVMTQMAEVISELTHPYYEQRRVSGAPGALPLLDPTSEEADAVGLGQQSRELERKVLQLRMKIHELRARGSRAT